MVKTILLASLLTGCVTVKPYQKEFLVSPLMMGKKSSFTERVTSQYENLGFSTSSGTGSTCPTCGG